MTALKQMAATRAPKVGHFIVEMRLPDAGAVCQPGFVPFS